MQTWKETDKETLETEETEDKESKIKRRRILKGRRRG